MKTIFAFAAAAAGVAVFAGGAAYAQQAPAPAPGGQPQGPGQASPVVAPGLESSGVGHDQPLRTESNFARDRNVSVRERPRPDYEAPGIRAGGFLVFPRVTASLAYDDNIYATDTNKVSAGIGEIVPEVAIRSQWSRNELSAFARAAITRYFNHSSENTEDYAVGAAGRLDLLRASNLYASGSFVSAHEPRTSPTAPTAASSPIHYDQWQATFGGVHEMNRLRLSGRVNYNDFRYDNATTVAGDPLLQNFRNRNVWTETGRAEYAVSPDTALYVSAQFNQRNYHLHPPTVPFDKNSSGYDVAVGANFDLTRVIRGEVQVGYMSQGYRSSAFKDINGVSVRAAVDWFPTEITTVNLSASRTIEEAAIENASGYLATSGGLRVDHELLRNVLLSARGGYEYDEYRGIDRNDKRPSAGVSATYLLNRKIGLTVAYDYLKLTSSGVDKVPNYSDNRVTGSLTLQF